ncbi:MAG: MFS transporter [Clostridiales bacterium]|nr:MFS transporter [Clostridiales bacterium]
MEQVKPQLPVVSGLSGKLDTGKTIKISMAFAWISIFNSVLDTALPVILTAAPEQGGLGLSFTAKGMVMALDNVLGLFLLPLFGYLSDRCRSKFGKRTPFIVVGAAGAVLSWTGAGLALSAGASWLFLIALGLGIAFIAMSRPAALSLLPDLTRRRHRRTANAVTQIISIISTVVGIVLVSLFLPLSYASVFYAAVAAIAGLLVVFLFTVREKRWESQLAEDEGAAREEAQAEEAEAVSMAGGAGSNIRRNRMIFLCAVFFFYVSYNGLVSSLSNYATEVLKLSESTFTIPQLLCLVAASIAAVPVSKIPARIKRKTQLLIGLALMLAAFVLVGTQRGMTPLMIAGFVIAGVGYSITIVNLYPYMLELSPAAQVGKYTGIFNNAMMVAMIVTPILSGYLTDLFSLSILFPYCITALVLSGLCVLGIREKSVQPTDKEAPA